MSAAPGGPLLRLELAAIGPLDEVAFETAAPEVRGADLTICFWFYAEPAPGTRVMANVGNEWASRAGWSVMIRGERLVFRVGFAGGQARGVGRALTDSDRWHHFVGLVDRAAREVAAYLDGSPRGWRPTTVVEAVDPGSIRGEEKLIIGGYTDAAGGHYDRRFGRRGSGLVDDFRLYPRRLSPAEIASFLPADGDPPAAAFTVTLDRAEAPASLRFSAAPTGVGFLWDFGDGARGQGKIVSHRYRYAGRYRVRLTVIDHNHRQGVTERDIVLAGAENPLKIRPLFISGSEGYACFRIPALVRAANGDLLAFAEGRVAGCSDATTAIRLVCKRSRDRGRSWGPLQVVARNVLGGVEHACLNPAPVVDTVRGSGRLVVVFNKLEVSEWRLTAGEGVSRVCCAISDDHGLTWSERDITLQVHRPYNPRYAHLYPEAAREENSGADWRKQVPTLGHAIQLRGTPANPGIRGRLFYIGSRTEGDDDVFHSSNYAFWSDDLGESWQLGDAITVREDGGSAKGLNEATAVELAGGAVLINSRNYRAGRAVGCRAVTIGTFDAAGRIHFGAARDHQALIDSGVQASLLGLPGGGSEGTGEGLLIFANPAHPRARRRLTVRLSRDGGRSWPAGRLIDPGPAAYSDLAALDEATLGLVYERGNHGGIAFVTFGLDWLAAGSDGA